MWQSENCDVCANILYWMIYYMDKYIFDESNGLWYELQGDYYIPCRYVTMLVLITFTAQRASLVHMKNWSR